MVKQCSLSKCHCLLFVLVFAAVGYLYTMNVKNVELNPKMWIQRHSAKLFVPFGRQAAVSENTGGFTAAPSSSDGFPPRESTTTQKPATPPQTTAASAVTQLPTQAARLTPLPYASPGLYLVEYPHRYHFVINEPQKCEHEEPFVVLMVQVAPNNRLDRDIIRSTWGTQRLVHGKVVGLFFLLGSSDEQRPEELLQESERHRDLIQSNFLDCYKNLTIKTMVMMEWLNSYCSSASYAMKIDSDMFLNVPNLVHMLLGAPRTNFMTGLVAYNSVVLRDPSSKWYLPVDLYPDEIYPPYTLGLGYVLSLDLPEKLLQVSRHVKPLYIEDVYLGLCMKHLGIAPTNPPSGNYFHVFPVTYSRCAFSQIVATTILSDIDRVLLWKDFTSSGPYCP